MGGGLCGVRHPPGLRDCRQISKILAFVGKYRVSGSIKEASIFMPTLPKVTDISQHRIYSKFILIKKVVNRVL